MGRRMPQHNESSGKFFAANVIFVYGFSFVFNLMYHWVIIPRKASAAYSTTKGFLLNTYSHVHNGVVFPRKLFATSVTLERLHLCMYNICCYDEL